MTSPTVPSALRSRPAADYAVAPANLLATVPPGVPLEDAAALPVAGLTAWQVIVEHARSTP